MLDNIIINFYDVQTYNEYSLKEYIYNIVKDKCECKEFHPKFWSKYYLKKNNMIMLISF